MDLVLKVNERIKQALVKFIHVLCIALVPVYLQNVMLICKAQALKKVLATNCSAMNSLVIVNVGQLFIQSLVDPRTFALMGGETIKCEIILP